METNNIHSIVSNCAFGYAITSRSGFDREPTIATLSLCTNTIDLEIFIPGSTVFTVDTARHPVR